MRGKPAAPVLVADAKRARDELGWAPRFHRFRLGEIGLSSVVAAELAYAVAKSGSERNRRPLEMFLAPLEIFPFDEKAVWAYGELRVDLERRGEPIGSLDTMTGAHALSLSAVPVTNNTRELPRVKGLRLENRASQASIR